MSTQIISKVSEITLNDVPTTVYTVGFIYDGETNEYYIKASAFVKLLEKEGLTVKNLALGGVWWVHIILNPVTAKTHVEKLGKLTGKTVILPDGREVIVERSNSYVLSGFDLKSHSWWSHDLRHSDLVLGG